MKLLRLLFLILFSPALFPYAFSQHHPDYVRGDLLVSLDPSVSPKQWIARWQTFQGTPTGLTIREQLSENLNIWLLQFDPEAIDESHFLEELRRKDPAVLAAQWNHILQQRTTQPNDPGFSNQWQYINTGQGGGQPGSDLDVDLAWDITTGGQTALGDTIVVCIIDDGLDPTHMDFGNNLWLNHGEIPGNGIDDDQNGYVDDYRGWNARRNNGQIDDVNTHGTSVAAIVGAKGNNGVGVSGVNWNVKLMIVVGGINASRESDYLKAFEYPLRQRRLYNQTGGKKGAFVVATNGSWGVDNGQAEDFPLWSAFYDTLGAQGVLNVGAVTNNNNTDIDQSGDMPASSPSSFLITVTNVDFRDQKVDGAGFGATTVDLAAYGGSPETGVWTAKNNNSYGRFPGTSAAAPHVAGAIGLLYSAPCRSFASLSRSDPAAAAALVRTAIFDGAQPIAAMAGRTVTGGRLNIFNSLQVLLQECVDCYPTSSLEATSITTTSASLSWNRNDSITRVDLRWRAVGDTEWIAIANVQSPYQLGNLKACTNYEFQLNTFCGATELGYGPGSTFRTDGCCSPPSNLRTVIRLEDRFFIRWDVVTAARGYDVRIRTEAAQAWDTVTANRDGSFATSNLTPCTNYELQVRTRCEGETSAFGASYWVRTLGCGFCIDMGDKYCRVGNVDGSEEWITRVQLQTLDHSSGSGGYSDHTGLEAPLLRQDGSYNITVSPGFAGQAQGRYTEVFIDFNQDGVFSASETVFTSTRSSTAVSAAITVPADARLGITRMRVSMLSKPNIGPCPGAIAQIGEVEDYCVKIDPATPTANPGRPALQIQTFPNPFSHSFTMRATLPEAEPKLTVILTDAFGRSLRTWARINLPPGQYEENFSLDEMPAGLYWLIFTGERSGNSVQRLLKR